MAECFNVYLDESCHLENDRIPVMTLGAVWCPADKAREVSLRIRDIRRQHQLAGQFEIKWTKVSPAKYGFYQAVLVKLRKEYEAWIKNPAAKKLTPPQGTASLLLLHMVDELNWKRAKTTGTAPRAAPAPCPQQNYRPTRARRQEAVPNNYQDIAARISQCYDQGLPFWA